MVRWVGRKPVERYIERVYRAIKEEDPDGLVTYVNYPTTEYLQLPFLDLLSFNVYLETRERLEAYLARLQNIAGERPLLMSEVGLDSHTQWRGSSGGLAGLAGANGVRGGVRRRRDLRLDGRVVQGRGRGFGLGVRPHEKGS